MKPSKSKIQIWNRLVKEVFNHPKSGYSLFVYEMCRRRILGTTKKEFREIGHDFGIKDIKGYFDWDENNSQQDKEFKLTRDCSQFNSPADKLKSGGTHREN